MRYRCALVIILASFGALLDVRAQQSTPSARAGDAFDLLFNMDEESAATAMGALQRDSLADLLKGTRQRLEVALVLDGTDSMGGDLESVVASLRMMADGLQRGAASKKEISYSLVIYRDETARSGIVSFPMGKEFSADVEAVRKALQGVVTESGAPYFNEAVDQGLMAAIQDLKWTTGDGVSRWILLAGDAPPPPATLPDGSKNSRNKFDVKQLIDAAYGKPERRITINSVLCTSGFADGADPELTATYELAAPQLANFMKELEQGTDGVFFNLRDKDVRQNLIAAAEKKRRTQPQQIATITPQHVQEVALATRNARGSAVRIAVLPHSPLSDLQFDPDSPGMIYATEFRTQLGKLPNVETVSTDKIQSAAEGAAEYAAAPERFFREICRKTGARFVVWGEYGVADEKLSLRTKMYKSVDGSEIASAADDSPDVTASDPQQVAVAIETVDAGSDLGETAIVSTAVLRLLREASARLRAEGDAGAADILAAPEKSEAVLDRFVPVCESLRARRELLSALERADRALQFAKADSAGTTLLHEAEKRLKTVLELEPENAFALAILASVYRNLSDLKVSEDGVGDYYKTLERAHAAVGKADPSIKTEVEADYLLLIKKLPKEAIAKYEQLTTAPETDLKSSLRAHWMLAGIYAGDWGVADEFVDPTKAREHIVHILARWGDSPEAAFYKEALKWNDSEGSTLPYAPRVHPTPELATSN